MKHKYTLIAFFFNLILFSQVGIGTVVPKAALDITSTSDGFLIPRIALSATNTATVTTPTISELVYNTATNGAGLTAVTPGFYYWNGAKWVPLANSSNNDNDWKLAGNTGTTAGTDFLGTIDAQDLIIKTTDTERARITYDGRFLFNTTTNDAISGADNVFEVLASTDGDDAISGYANGATGVGVYGKNSGGNGGYGVLGFAENPAGVGVYGRANGGTASSQSSGVYGYLDESVAGNQDVAGVIGIQTNTVQGTGGYNGPGVPSANSALAGVYGLFGSKVTTAATNAYFFGVIGQLGTTGGTTVIPRRTGGLLGENGGAWASNAYRNSAGTLFGLYSSTATVGNGMGKMATVPSVNNNIGMGINGGFMGGYVQGSQFGLVSKGQDFGIYVDGNTIANKPYIQLIKGNNNRVAIYSSASTSIDVSTRGKGKLINGEAFITFNEAFKNSVSISELSKSEKSLESINITVTPVGDSNGVHISKITNNGFYIKENNKGKSNISFNWLAIGTQKGYENGISVSDVVLSSNFDNNMREVMIPDTENQNINESASPIYFDGNKIRFEEAPEGLNKAKQVTAVPFAK